MSTDRVVIVEGGGLITACGDAGQTWNAIVAGKTGARRIETPLASMPQINIAAPADMTSISPHAYDVMQRAERRYAQRWAPAHMMAVGAAYSAIQNIPLKHFLPENASDVAVSFGIAQGSTGFQVAVAKAFLSGEPRQLVAQAIEGLPHMSSFHVAEAFEFKGPTPTYADACAAGIYALWGAVMLLWSGQAELVFWGGAEDLVTGGSGLASFAAMQVMTSIPDGKEVGEVPSAFDVSSSGFVLGSGAVVCAVMKESLAQRLGIASAKRNDGFLVSWRYRTDNAIG